MTVATLIYCTDCHSSDSASGARGPHGSIHRYLLAGRYETVGFHPGEQFFLRTLLPLPQ